ncbi:MAG: DUF3299 domain-containing protein [Rubrivivax sp.]|nr:DUF3299 domain-containing protein [Rubrivivax sp.]
MPARLIAALLGLFAAAATAQVQPPPAMPATPAAPAPKAAPPVVVGGFRVIQWEELVPAGWDPMKEFKDVNLGALNDGDPKALQMMKRVREVWDNAPANPALDGKAVRIPGFVVPLEENKEGLTEFLLVPYFGACIHTPPPPANQIIHVQPKEAAKGVRSMDAVWISGLLRREKTDSYMGTSGYRMEAQRIEPYREPDGKK